MNARPLYEEDFHAWALAQARVLRELGARVTLPNELDLDHVIEEIEDLGNEQRAKVESNLIQALIHLIKLHVLPGDDAARHWAKEIGAFLLNARRAYRPSMVRLIDLEGVWKDARRRAIEDLEIDGHSVEPPPELTPFTLADLLDEAATTRGLLTTLRASMDRSEAA